MKITDVSSRLLGRCARLALLGLVLASGLSRIASAQEIEPNEFVTAPDGTNLFLAYYLYGHNTSYNISGLGTIKGSGLETNIGLARYVHYDYIAGMPAGVQIFQAFGSESAGHVGTQSLGSTFGASNVNLSAFIWPYSSVEKKQYFVVTGFLEPPTGSYDKNAALNASSIFGSSAWSGDLQLGWDQGIGDHFSYDLAFDSQFFGTLSQPGGRRLTEDPSFRLQAWFNWNWSRAFQTSIGWESMLGGKQYTNDFFNGSTSQFERIRAAASLFVAANAQVLLELNHDFSAPGGFKQTFGLTTRVLYVF